jgi:hypothetical protein
VDDDIAQVEAADDAMSASDDPEILAGKKKGDDDGDGIIAVLIG